MSWFNVFPKTKIDEDILELYLEIELYIDEIDIKIKNYLENTKEYFKNNEKNKNFYTILKIQSFFNKIKQDYSKSYTVRKNKNHYNFNKSSHARSEKLLIEEQLKMIKLFLEEILKDIEKLTTNIKDNSFENSNHKIETITKKLNENYKQKEIMNKLEKDIKKQEENFHIFDIIKKKDEHIIFEIINKIIQESIANEKNEVWLISQKNKEKKLYFSQNLSINQIKYLELVPLLNIEELQKRSTIINQLHKDETLPLLHYNLIINEKNIHVIPKNYQNKLKNYLFAA